ncbi:MAG: mannonate dehydratase [Flavobacteriaceae bacterium]|nr:mannonate dehydratase [Flavobacteriaceae bacterium]
MTSKSGFLSHSMRWYGPRDYIKLETLKNHGIKNIVSSLHDIPVGKIWTLDEIKSYQSFIQKSGFKWTVVESLPVHEDIKTQAKGFKHKIDNYKKSIENLASQNIRTITYNFMPVLDWLRTHHRKPYKNKGFTLSFNRHHMVYFDLYHLRPKTSKKWYTEKEQEIAFNLNEKLSNKQKTTLVKSILQGLPGDSENFTMDSMLKLMEPYTSIDKKQLQEHLLYFLDQMIPVAQENGVNMVIHPDDPPFSVLGLPRIVGTENDLTEIFESNPSLSNGLCFCSGSLGSHHENDVLKIYSKHAHRIHFLHLRNVKKRKTYHFFETDIFEGDVKMKKLMQLIYNHYQTNSLKVPMRPDHGLLLHEESRLNVYPGYSLMGRLESLEELKHLENEIGST